MKTRDNWTNSTIDRYLDEIGREPLMTPEEEIRLGRLVRQGQALKAIGRKLTRKEELVRRRADKAKHRFIRANLRLVVYVAKRYQNKTIFMDLLDLVQEASLGLMRAVELYDPERGYKFSTYAYWWVKQAINRSISAQERAIRRPSNICELAHKLTKLRETETARLGRTPTLDELAAAANVNRSELELLMERGNGCYSLDAPIFGNDEINLADNIVDPNSPDQHDVDEALEAQLRLPKLEAGLNRLSEQERLFLVKRYGLFGEREHTLNELGREAGISRERVRQLTEQALKKLRFFLSQQLPLGPNHTSEEVGEEATTLESGKRSSGRAVETFRPRTGSSPALLCA